MTVEEITIDGQRYTLTPIHNITPIHKNGNEGTTEYPNENGGNDEKYGRGFKGGKRSKKEKKAKGTRKLSPYMRFAQNARKEILAKDPSLKSDIIAVGRKIGEMWRGLSDAEKAKY